MSETSPAVEDLREGERYDREALHQKYGGAKYRGIAPSADHPYVFIFTGESGAEHGYKDEFRGDTFIYTGEGREGDMEWSMGNKAIRDHRENNEELHLFESTDGAWQVIYLGQFECVDWFEEQLPDTNGNMRRGIRFKLEPVENAVPIDQPDLDGLTTRKLYEKASEASHGTNGGSGGETSTTTQTVYPRSIVIREYALKVADGVCQACEEDAPFVDQNNEPFLEVHHLHRRSDGGPDHPENVIAICPNCHRRVHQGKDKEELNDELIAKARDLAPGH